MATITGLTAERMQELLEGWENVAGRQDWIEGEIGPIKIDLGEANARLKELNEITLPGLLNNLLTNAALLDDLNDNVLPALAQAQENNANLLEDLNTITLPSLLENLGNIEENSINLPQVLTGTEEPEEAIGRDLLVGDYWVDDNQTRRMWDGTQWANFDVDIADFSLTARKFKTSTHMIYE